MRGIFFPQLVLSAQKWWQTIKVSCLFVLALVRFHLILLSSLDFLSCVFPMLLILNFFTSCFKFRVVARRATSEFKSLAKATVFFREPLWNSKSARCLSFFCAWGEAVPELHSLPTDFCQSQSVQGAHLGSGWPEASQSMASHFILEWFRGGLHIDKIFLWKLLPQWLSVACWVCQMALSDCTESFLYESVAFERTSAPFRITSFYQVQKESVDKFAF